MLFKCVKNPLGVGKILSPLNVAEIPQRSLIMYWQSQHKMEEKEKRKHRVVRYTMLLYRLLRNTGLVCEISA